MRIDNICVICGNTEEVEERLCAACFENAPVGEWFPKVGDTIRCPIGDLVGKPHEFVKGSGRLAFLDIMGLPFHVHEVCETCAVGYV